LFAKLPTAMHEVGAVQLTAFRLGPVRAAGLRIGTTDHRAPFHRSPRSPATAMHEAALVQETLAN
jgi:hypothetical protein